ncbi:MAG TPA: DHA2 family efflux MFS transporter permease subunit [Devosiaceae bacterium]|jgi:EmrB/QacA subfamily drug resistance transporter
MTSFSPQARNVALIVAAALFMQLLDGVIIITALPQMAVAFGVKTLDMSVGVTIYMLANAIFIPTAGWVADRFGARRIFLLSILLFTAASLVCGLSTNLTVFTIARAVQGIGGALMVPVGRIIVLRSVKKTEIVSAIAMTVWPALFAPVIGPAIGGFLTTYVSWQWNFWINIPLGLAGVLFALRIIPADGERRVTPFDWTGFALCAASLAGLLYGLDTLVSSALPRGVSILMVVAGAIAGVLAVLWLRRRQHPLLDLSTLRIHTFTSAEVGAGPVFRLTFNATSFLLPLLFQIVFGLDPLQAGGLVIVYFLGNLGIKPLTTGILRRFGFRNILIWNGLFAAICIALCGFLAPDTPYPLLLIVLILAGCTRSMQFTGLFTLAFADVDPARRSSASTISTMFQQIAMVFGIALATGFLNLSQIMRSASSLGLADFRMAFVLMGVIALAASLQLMRLDREAGAEVSGHRTA